MLAQPYGYPSVMSSYAFDRTSSAGDDMGPPSTGGATNDVACAANLEAATIGTWVCEHRDPTILRMVGFRRAVAGTDLSRWWDNGANAIAFSRGDKGFVAISRETGVRHRDGAERPFRRHLLRRADGRKGRRGVRGDPRGGGCGRRGAAEPGRQHRHRDPRRGEAVSAAWRWSW